MRKTTSVCPICLTRIPAMRVFTQGEWQQKKTCPTHGDFTTVLWRGSEDMDAWVGDTPEHGADTVLCCPDHCGLCANHLRGTCCTLLEVTDRCNLSCPFCFADPQARQDPTLQQLQAQIDDLARQTGGTLLQLSGGEPTLRDDLPQLVAYAKQAGCTYVQLNTNGLRLAQEPDYVAALAQAGLSFVFLQFDGTDDGVFQAMRGRTLLSAKEQAIAHCARHHIGVTLVPTLVPGVNTQQVGALVRYAMEHAPAVRGIHFQPVSYFGRIPFVPSPQQRYTLGELIDDIATQTQGLVPRSSLVPSSCDHPLCGLHGDYIVMPQGRLEPLSRRGANAPCCCERDPARQNREYIARRWLRGAEDGCCPDQPAPDIHSLDGFLQRKRSHGFTITSMAFQDAGNLDLERLRQCSLHVYRHGRLIPFCAAYLTHFAL